MCLVGVSAHVCWMSLQLLHFRFVVTSSMHDIHIEKRERESEWIILSFLDLNFFPPAKGIEYNIIISYLYKYIYIYITSHKKNINTEFGIDIPSTPPQTSSPHSSRACAWRQAWISSSLCCAASRCCASFEAKSYDRCSAQVTNTSAFDYMGSYILVATAFATCCKAGQNAKVRISEDFQLNFLRLPTQT